jgi:hypothetical protein
MISLETRVQFPAGEYIFAGQPLLIIVGMVASFFFARQSNHGGNVKQAKYLESSWRGKDIALTIANLLDLTSVHPDEQLPG